MKSFRNQLIKQRRIHWRLQHQSGSWAPPEPTSQETPSFLFQSSPSGFEPKLKHKKPSQY
ncbi:hypothetical protein RchiOBHm_Chr2g0115711 [Rosa chinensis]|uniref:Uncharacterized protein n=1 Tax=Rosa chinensis TaxID=74649 RepID=A0A2P6RR18_ROSCH|nr:hypothetical protein RchiOBHm_Chr2g0115711 [Rosa chinensis]